MDPHEAHLEELVRALEACRVRRRVAERLGLNAVRLRAIELEGSDLAEAIQYHCSPTDFPLPEGVQPLSPPRATALAIARRILERYLTLLQLRRSVLHAALRAGDESRVAELVRALRADEAAIRKHCQRAHLAVPPELTS
jgi:hypothetical protein